MGKRIYITLAVIVAFASIAWWTDSFLLCVFGVGGMIWIGVPALIAAAILLLFSKRHRLLRPVGLGLRNIVIGFLCFMGAAIPTNHFVFQWEERAAKSYPAKVSSCIEKYRREHGAYPTSLDLISEKPRIPRLLRPDGYHSDGKTYSFLFSQSGSLFNAWYFSSETGRWDLST